MTSGCDGLPANGRAPSPAVWGDLHSRFGWLTAQFERGDLEALAARLLHIPLPARTPLIARDTSSCSLYLVTEGALSVTVSLTGRFRPANKPIAVQQLTSMCRDVAAQEGFEPDALALGHIGAGGWIGAGGLMNLEPLGYSVTVARDSWLLVLTASQFARLQRERITAASTLLQVFSLLMADRFRAYHRFRAEAGPSTAGSARSTALASLALLLGASGV